MSATIYCPKCGTPLTDKPKTASEINLRMTMIQEELARYRIAPHPQCRELSDELDHLKSIYEKVLTSEGAK